MGGNASKSHTKVVQGNFTLQGTENNFNQGATGFKVKGDLNVDELGNVTIGDDKNQRRFSKVPSKLKQASDGKNWRYRKDVGMHMERVLENKLKNANLGGPEMVRRTLVLCPKTEDEASVKERFQNLTKDKAFLQSDFTFFTPEVSAEKRIVSWLNSHDLPEGEFQWIINDGCASNMMSKMNGKNTWNEFLWNRLADNGEFLQENEISTEKTLDALVNFVLVQYDSGFTKMRHNWTKWTNNKKNISDARKKLKTLADFFKKGNTEVRTKFVMEYLTGYFEQLEKEKGLKEALGVAKNEIISLEKFGEKMKESVMKDNERFSSPTTLDTMMRNIVYESRNNELLFTKYGKWRYE